MQTTNKPNIKFQKSFKQTSELVNFCKEISSICNDFDGLNNPFFIDTEYDNFLKIPWLYYATIDLKIVGFISVYVIDSYNVEICGFILPEYRRGKVASNLFAMMVMDFEEMSFTLSMSPDNDFGKAFAYKMGFTYCTTECSMQLKKEQHISFKDALSLNPEKQDDEFFIRGLIDGREIGHSTISVFDTVVCIHDVEVYEEYRSKGYGYRLIGTLLNHIFEKYDSAILHVTKENEPAYRLYKKVGFEVVEELEYYEV